MKHKRWHKKWELLGGSTIWLTPKEVENITKVYEFLESNTDMKQKNKNEFSISQIAQATGVNRKQVSRYALLLSMVQKPFPQITKLRASHFKSKIVHLVRLIRLI